MDILYEDDGVLVINKPPGVLVHPDGHTQEETVSDWFVRTHPHAHEVGESLKLSNGEVVMRPGVVHRLDADTSGVLILVKTPEAHAYIKNQFQERLIAKTYHAITYGIPKEKKGVISAPIGRSAKNFKLRSAQRGARGALREAETGYEYDTEEGEFGLVRLFPKTGRTHQLRVHLKYIHHPIVCDPLYAPGKPCALGLKRLALHASKISFKNLDGSQVGVEAPFPEDFENAVSQLA